MSECNQIAAQYIAALSRQIDFLAAWGLAALGGLLAIGLGIELHNHTNPDTLIPACYLPWWFAVILLGLSLLFSYLAVNLLTQVIPKICEHDFSNTQVTLRQCVQLYGAMIWMMRLQYFSFALAVVFGVIFFVVNSTS